jgi:hypothetical protein
MNTAASLSKISACVVAALGLTAAPACAQNAAICANEAPAPTISSPVIFGGVSGAIKQDAAFDCMMWQTFVYLNWPVQSGQRGVPNPSAAFGTAGETVWESFKSSADTFPLNGQNPGPWNSPVLMPQNLPQALSAARRNQVADGKLRVLRQLSKFSAVLKQKTPPTLSEKTQVGGGILVDQTGQDVYYEIALNQSEYEYIVTNKLYDANAQYTFASTQGVGLPLGSTSTNPQTSGAIEVKAAWKVLSPAELSANPVRFHTAQALLPGATQPVTVGLAGLHIAQRAENMYQLVWATFSQIDNAPPFGPTPSQGNFSFFKPGCSIATCPVNQKTTPPQPTQVMQTTQPPSPAAKVNQYMQALIAQQSPNTPWQFYQLVNVQWPTAAVQLPTPPIPSSPANGSPPIGSPNTTILLNPVLETFFQGQTLSCLGCHQSAIAANPQKAANNYPSSYSFVFEHATVAAPGLLLAPGKPIPGDSR